MVGGGGGSSSGYVPRGGGAKSAVSRASCPRSFCLTIHLHRSRLRCVELAPCSALATWSEMSYVVPSRLYGPSVKPRTQQSRRRERGRRGGFGHIASLFLEFGRRERDSETERDRERDAHTHTQTMVCGHLVLQVTARVHERRLFGRAGGAAPRDGAQLRPWPLGWWP